MAGGQWEVVGGKAKKNKAKNDIPKAAKEKKAKESTNFEISGPISESETIYAAFLEKERRSIPKPKVNVNEVVKSKDKNAQQKKKKTEKKAGTLSKIPLEDIFAAITEEDLKNLVATLEVLRPENPLLWLKDLVSFLNLKLDAAIEDYTFSQKPREYPSTLLKKGVYSQIVKLFKHCRTQMLNVFFEFCLQNLVQDILKGLHVLGYLTVLQCLAQEMPSVAVANVPKCIELCTSHHNRQNVCVAIMWAAGQAGNKNLEAGFRVWFDLMFPLIGTKTCTSFAVEYLEKLVRNDDLAKIDKSIIGVKDLFPVLDFIYSKDVVKNVQKRILAVYPILKKLSYGPQPETVLRNYFPSYLHRLRPQSPQPLKQEILSSLVDCLEKDSLSYSIWRQLYTKHFVQSKLLISHLNEEWEKLPSKFFSKSLLDTLSVFQVTNEEFVTSGKKDSDVEECILINKELLTKLNSRVFSWFRVVLLFIFMFSLLLICDIMIHDSFIDSNTGKLMKDSGLLVICTQAGEKLGYYYGRAYKLLQMYLPGFIVWTRKTFGPYFELFWIKFSTGMVYLWKSTLVIRTWCNQNIPFLLDVIDKKFPVYGAQVLNMLNNLATFLLSHLQFVGRHLVNSCETLVIWLQSNAYIRNTLEAFQSHSIALLEILQGYAKSLLHFV
ncbi:Transmembrane protein 214-B, partial [Stegodyphus mimosarum]